MHNYIIKLELNTKIHYKLIRSESTIDINDSKLEKYLQSLSENKEYKIIKIIEISEHEKDILDYIIYLHDSHSSILENMLFKK